VQKPSPTFFKIISTDYLAQNFFIMIFAGWVIYGIDALFEGNSTLFLAVIAAILTPLGLLTFFWRYRLIVSTFVNGIETVGQVITIDTISTGKKRRDYIIHYEYNLNGQTYQFRNRVKKNTYARTIKQGQQVNLLAHEKTPHIAFIKEIYLEPI
jgi:hypothetical protein